MTTSLTYSALAAVLRSAGFIQDPAEYHGALCGALCVLLVSSVAPLSILERDDDFDASAALPELIALRDATAAMLADSDGDIAILLPDDDQPLAVRTQAVATWCEGFLLGLALKKGLNLKQEQPEVREIITDFTELTRAVHDDAAEAEGDEEAYAEVVEYLRVGLQLLFMSLSPKPMSNQKASKTVH